jgi:disulfide bond formation protein DsbB
MSTAPVTAAVSDPIMGRFDDQIDYYEAKSSKCQRYYKRIKLFEIVAAALIPFLAALHVSDTNTYVHFAVGIVTAALGVMITILEGVLQLNQYQQLWITCRATGEAMKHEKFMYIAKAGAYAAAAERHALLAERIETIGSQENTKWASLTQQQPGSKSGALA